MHEIAKKIMDGVKAKINSCGIEGITEQELIEMKYWTCVADAMTSYDYHSKIVKEMEKTENQYGVNYDENGRFYTKNSNMIPMYYRDMDMRDGRMYYSEMGGMNGSHMGNSSSNGGNTSNRGYSESGNSNSHRGYSESRYEKARRGYEESKEMNPSSENLDKMEEIFDEFDRDMKQLKPKMSQNEKNLARTKLTTMANGMM